MRLIRLIRLIFRIIRNMIKIAYLKRKETSLPGIPLDNQYDALMKRVDRYNARQRIFPYIDSVIFVLWIVVILWLVSNV